MKDEDDFLFHLRDYAFNAIPHNKAKTIISEARANLKERESFGISKHKAKAEARRNGERVRGSFSYNTDTDYAKKAGYVISQIIKAHPTEIMYLSDCKKFVKEFIDNNYDWETQANTIHSYIYATMAALNINDYHDLGFKKLAKRCTHKNRRCRAESKSDKKLTGDLFNLVRAFCAGTGARRGGAMDVCSDDLYLDDEGNYLVKLTEKGGKTRLAIILPDFVELIKTLFEHPLGNTVNGRTYLFPLNAFAKNLSLHILRDRYAEKLYLKLLAEGKYNTDELYRCRKERKGDVFDAGAVLKTSEYLGHHRVNVAVDNYLFNVKMTEDELDKYKEGK